jgi:hypothetical protein
MLCLHWDFGVDLRWKQASAPAYVKFILGLGLIEDITVNSRMAGRKLGIEFIC